MKNQLRIVFMGTPEFAVESLDRLHKSKHKVIGVVTAPDKPAGRGGKLRSSAVKIYSDEQNLTVWQPTNLKDESFVERLKVANPDLIVVVAFRMLPSVVWRIPPMGTINLHASLLPDYRGAAPINWAIINGETETGVTTFYINEKIDTGDIIDQQKVVIPPEMNVGELHDQLMTIGAGLLVKTIDQIAKREIEPRSQNVVSVEKQLHDAPKITKENARIDWKQSAPHVLNLIRGMSPYPGAYTINPHNDSVIKIFKASAGSHRASPGEIVSDGKHFFEVGTGTKSIAVEELQLAGKKRVAVRDFLNGSQLDQFARLK